MAEAWQLADLLDPDALFDNGYEVLKKVAEGGQGVVYRARYAGLENRGVLAANVEVAIKMVPAVDLQPREVLIQGQLNHRNIVKLFDVFPYALSCLRAQHLYVARPR